MITLTVSPPPGDIAKQWAEKAEAFPEGVRKVLLKAMIGLQQYVIENKLSGQVLHHRTGNLIRSLTAEAREEPAGTQTASLSVGKEAFYGILHEYGGQFRVREHLRTSSLGNAYTVRAYTMTVPERSFLRTALAETRDRIIEDVSADILKLVTS